MSIAGSVRTATVGGEIGLVAGGPASVGGTVVADGRLLLQAGALTIGAGAQLRAGDISLALSGALQNAGSVVSAADRVVRASGVGNAGSAGAVARLSGRVLDIEAANAVDAGAWSVTEATDAARIVAGSSNLDLFNANDVAAGRFAFGRDLVFGANAQGLVVEAGREIMRSAPPSALAATSPS